MAHIIAIAGPSCAGKTELSKLLAARLDAPILPIDAYYVNLDHIPFAERCRFNFDEPNALDHALLRQHVEALAQDRAVERPTYDFTVHTRAAATERILPARYVILEGLFALYWDDLRPLLDTKVFVHVPDALCFSRRNARDIHERGRTPESVLEQYEKTVRPMAQLYVLPTARWADIVVSGDRPLEESMQAILRHLRPEPAVPRAPVRLTTPS